MMKMKYFKLVCSLFLSSQFRRKRLPFFGEERQNSKKNTVVALIVAFDKTLLLINF